MWGLTMSKIFFALGVWMSGDAVLAESEVFGDVAAVDAEPAAADDAADDGGLCCSVYAAAAAASVGTK